MFDILFKNACIVTMNDSEPVIESGYLGVTGKKISYIGKAAPNDKGKREIDCKGNILMPGLINAHTHTAMTLLRGVADDYTLNEWLFNHIFPIEAKLDSRATAIGFTLGVAEMLSYGVTSINDMYFFQNDIIRIAADIGIRGYFSNGIVALSPDYDFYKDRSIRETLEMLEYDLPDRVKPQLSIHSERTSEPYVWDMAVEFAQKHNITMHIHLSETLSDHTECIKKHGKTPAEVLSEHGVFSVPTVAAHCVHVSESDMDIMAKYNVTAVHNPVSNLKLASGIADVVAMQRHGVNVALGTDGVCSNNSHDLFEEIKLSALLAKNKHSDPSLFTAYDALKLATVNGAKSQGNYGVTGQLIEGYEADIIMLDTQKVQNQPVHNPISSLVYTVTGKDCVLTMVQGKILYENGEFMTIDIEKALREMKEYALPLIMG
ncbi:MAG TPA: amidohydrolase [Clostridiales bacterium]|jgi:5-methylthioadenosine/S-adenosylhomocysteine deaminase|nr:amidohydrolase [Clostridiales bacterium]